MFQIPRGVAPAFRPGTLRLLPEDVAGELDTPLVDATTPRWTSGNLAEAFPGPMTVLSLEVSLNAMRAATDAFAQMIPLAPAVAERSRHHMLASLGHTIYINVAGLATSAAQAGQTPEEFEHELFGAPLPEGYQRPRRTAAQVAGLVRLGLAMGPKVAGLGRAIDAHGVLARHRADESLRLDDLDAAALLARFDALLEDLNVCWAAANLATGLVSQPMATLERRYGSAASRSARAGLDQLASAGAAHGARALAAAAAATPGGRAALAEADPAARLARLRRDEPALAARLDAVLARYGHRGPGECELANLVYADDPALLLDAAAKLVQRGDDLSADLSADPASSQSLMAAVDLPRGAARFVRRTVAASQRRERGRDAATLLTHAVRRTARALGARLATAGVLPDAMDVFSLRREELAAAVARLAAGSTDDADLTALVERRRKERQRLIDLRLPVMLDGPWEPVTNVLATAGHRLTGVAASGGTAVGRVRVVRGTLADLEPGEILVARVTDVGWTPFFAVAGAVVTDAGGLMAHAAVVARELGIPAVTGTDVATEVLVDGQLVEVDGTAGTVTVL
jgi:phosphohistidine swiveling domain-containing protein